jgi:hypothetical protein
MLRGPQGEHTFKDRWLRERNRSPAIAAIQIEQTVSRKWRGKTVTAQCHDGYWTIISPARFDSTVKYATLYAVVLRITNGRRYPRADQKRAKRLMSNWTGAKFFKLDTAIESANIADHGETKEAADPTTEE